VGVFEQLLHLPMAYFWLPGLAFLVVVGGFFMLARPAATPVEAPAKPAVTAVAQKPKEQRGMFRRHGNPIEVHVARPDDKKDPAVGSVMDRSMGGMRLALYHEVQAGAILSIRPVHADEMVPWVDLEVRSCKESKEMPDQFEVGCQYVKSPPYSIQLLFG
jgi:hypothetical protein